MLSFQILAENFFSSNATRQKFKIEFEAMEMLRVCGWQEARHVWDCSEKVE